VVQTPLDDDFVDAVQSELDSLFDDDLFIPSPGLKQKQEVPASLLKKRAVVQEQPASVSLHQQIKTILNQFNRRTGIAVESRLAALEKPVSAENAALILKTVATILKNTYQHAQATIIGVSFSCDGELIQGNIADNGLGFDASQLPPDGGLNKLQIIFEQSQGLLEISTYRHQGTTIHFQLPCHREDG
jgi:signal transduction histidine kinase